MSNSNSDFVLPTVEESKVVFEESLIKIRRDLLLRPGRKPYPYYSLITKRYAVVILATTPEGRYILNEEYRHPTGKVLLGCPGGYMDGEEDPIEAAKRELREESGFEAESLIMMGGAYPCAGLTGQKTFYIRAVGAQRKASPQLDEAELIRTVFKTQEELLHAISQGIELDGTLGTALFFETILKKSSTKFS